MSIISDRCCISSAAASNMVAVCQPSVPVLAAVAVMEAAGDPNVPHSMVLMGGPIDNARESTGVNKLAEMRGTDWFRRNVITKVPFPHPGFMCAMSIRALFSCTASSA